MSVAGVAISRAGRSACFAIVARRMWPSRGRSLSGARLTLRAVARRAVPRARAPLSTLRSVPSPLVEHTIAVAAPRLDERLPQWAGEGAVRIMLADAPVTASRDWFFGEPMAAEADEGGMQLSSTKKKRKMKMNKHKRRKRIKMNRLKKRFKTK